VRVSHTTLDERELARAATCCEKAPDKPERRSQSPWQDWPGAIEDTARLGSSAAATPSSRLSRIAVCRARFCLTRSCGRSLFSKLRKTRTTDSCKNKWRDVNSITAGGDERRRWTRADSERHITNAGTRRRGTLRRVRKSHERCRTIRATNAMRMCGPVVIGFDEARVAERRAEERPRRMTRSDRREP
jgi:hypothetical protein